jgi:L-rhamnose isomerase
MILFFNVKAKSKSTRMSQVDLISIMNWNLWAKKKSTGLEFNTGLSFFYVKDKTPEN